jgi:hypothetical protein
MTVFIGKPFQLFSFGIPLVHVCLLGSVPVKPVPDEFQQVRPKHLRHLWIVLLQVFASVASDSNKANADCVGTVNARPIDIRRSSVYLVVWQAPDSGKNTVDVLAILLRPRPIQRARLIGLHLRDYNVDHFTRQRQALVVDHGIIGIVDQALGAKRKSDGQEIGVGSLATAPFRVNNKVLDL